MIESAVKPASATTILLVRHGHVPGIEPERFRGRTEIELTERGVAEARKTADWIARFWRPTIIYTSPMKRCRDTGAAIAAQSQARTETLPSLNDLDYGAWQWQTHEEVAAKCPLLYLRWRNHPQLMRFPQGESLQELAAGRRMRCAWPSIHIRRKASSWWVMTASIAQCSCKSWISPCPHIGCFRKIPAQSARSPRHPTGSS